MDHLKLLALDEQDLKIISAHVQDAVMQVGDLSFASSNKRFIAPINRFAWEADKAKRFFRPRPQRRNSVLHFERVLGAKTSGIERDKPANVLSLLAVNFVPLEAPAGIIQLIFSGGGTIMLDVECVEARLADLGGAWEAASRPAHKV
ncbi:MAG: DUF2948 family protein [Pseudaminobacter sp.]|nr:DUF2948 family protein [Pseudaminobacter sp.]